MQSDDLVAQDVVAGRDRAGNRGATCETVGNQRVGRPSSGIGARNESTSIELEELKAVLVYAAKVAVDLGKVIDNGTMVALGPCVPCKLNRSASCDLTPDSAWLSTPVTDAIRRGVAVRRDEAVVRNGR